MLGYDRVRGISLLPQMQRHERLVADDHALDALALARVVVRGAPNTLALNHLGHLRVRTIFVSLRLGLLDQSERVRVAAASLNGWEGVASEAQC